MAKVELQTGGRGWATLPAKQKARFEEFGKHLERWSTVMGYDNRWTVIVKFVATKKYLAMCEDLDAVRYNRIKINASTKLLEDDEAHVLEDTAIHELLHIVIYPYTRFAERLERLAVTSQKGEEEDIRPLAEELHEREEEVISRLEVAFARRCHPREDEVIDMSGVVVKDVSPVKTKKKKEEAEEPKLPTP